jgi:1-acyl-sn-glycerol-3-phosphate acyltransferase
MQRGQHMAIFPEGARNKVHPETVQPLKEGVALIAGAVAADHMVAVVPIGFTYEAAGAFPSRPTLWVKRPIVDYVFEPAPFLVELRDDIQAAVDAAHSIAADKLS